MEELEDYQDWQELEAVYRVTGLIRRFNRLKKSDIPLGGYYLEKANLMDLDLRGAHLMGTNLKEANLCGTELEGAFFWKDTILDNWLTH